MRVGDLVVDPGSALNDSKCYSVSGIVISVISDVEVPPLIEVLWDDGNVSRQYSDDLEILNEKGR